LYFHNVNDLIYKTGNQQPFC